MVSNENNNQENVLNNEVAVDTVVVDTVQIADSNTILEESSAPPIEVSEPEKAIEPIVQDENIEAVDELKVVEVAEEVATVPVVEEEVEAPIVTEVTEEVATVPTVEEIVEAPIVTEVAEEVATVPVVEDVKVTPIASPKPAKPTEPSVYETNNAKFAEIFEELKVIKGNNGTIEVNIKTRIRGGFRAFYKDLPVFLPSSHFLLKRNPTDDELNSAIDKNFEVVIHELQEDETKRKTVIVSRKKMLEDAFWNSVKIGDRVNVPVSSVASFGIFLDLGGFEGLIHVSRLSNNHVDDPRTIAKKGDMMEAVIIELSREKNRIALSCKEQQESPWKNLGDEILVSSIVKGTVRRLTDFGAYIELKPGVDGLLRTSELSWTKRIKSPADILKVGMEVELFVININPEKRTVGLSLKRATENPWPLLKEKFTVGMEVMGKVVQVVQQGLIVTINDEIDGFMPRSKMKSVIKGKLAPFNVGDDIEVVISDLVVEEESLILALKETEDFDEPRQQRDSRDNRDRREPRQDRRDRPDRKQQSSTPKENEATGEGFSLGDLLSEKMKNSLMEN